MFNIEEELKKLPRSPGVYMHKDSLGEIIYVGKAINLRNRVRQYFRKQSQNDPKVRAMVSNIAEFEYISCATEMEALILECNLIKKYMPKYNILLKDDKAYPYIAVTTKEEYPRVIKTRSVKRDGSRYFGPYSDAAAVSTIIRLIDELYPLKKCPNLHFKAGTRPCLNYHIGKCQGICLGNVDKDQYMKMIDEVMDVLSGHDAELISKLERRMFEESELLHYEEAAKYRDYIASIRALGETQRASSVKDRDIDIIIPVITHNNSIIVRYIVRDGKLIGRELNYMADAAMSNNDGKDELVAAFLKQYYTRNSKLPKEIMLSSHIEDEMLLMELLDSVNADNAEDGSDIMHKTKLVVPERGEKKAVLDMAMADSVELAKTLDERAERDREKKLLLKEKIAELIIKCAELDGTVPALIAADDNREYRVEAYDISNFNGLDTVGAMVVYEGKTAIRSDYRKFKVKTAASGDDYGSLQEVLFRRLKRLKNGDEGFSKWPDILFIDGGLGQVHAVCKIMEALRLTIPVVGLAKDDAHRTRAIVFKDGSEIDLRGDKLLFSYAGTIQEEVHRFAITYMRGTKGKAMTKSILEEIPGIGPKRRAALLKHFGNIEKIRNADYLELMQVDGMNSKAAESISDYFSKRAADKMVADASEMVADKPDAADEPAK